uniref:Serine/threonine kinase 19 n=1 Tax=Eptatretus burgeri TaxID=7764 RepID=A0A8C4Q2U6_EPTBU
MSNKRRWLPEAFRTKRSRLGAAAGTSGDIWGEELPFEDVPSDTLTALHFLADLLPKDVLSKLDFPPIVLKHQLYSLLHNRTTVDQQLESLRKSGKVQVLNLGCAPDTYAVVTTSCYATRVRASSSGQPWDAVAERFLRQVSEHCGDIWLARERLIDLKFSDADVTKLINAGLLTARAVGSWWISIPGLGKFVKLYLKGRKAVLLAIQKSRHHEILESELKNRRLGPGAHLGVPYLLHDIIGADLLRCVNTTSGKILRLVADQHRRSGPCHQNPRFFVAEPSDAFTT